MYKVFLILIISGLLFSCDDEILEPSVQCIEAEVIGKIRTAGGGIAVSLANPIEGVVTWQGHDNVVELLNVPVEFTFPNTVIYFKAREAKEGERGPVSADGDESIELILYGSEFSDKGCSESL